MDDKNERLPISTATLCPKISVIISGPFFSVKSLARLPAGFFTPEKHPMNDPTLHIYQPASHHDDAYIFGNREGLEALKRQIEAALAGQPTDEEVFFQADGEGYSVVVRSASDA